MPSSMFLPLSLLFMFLFRNDQINFKKVYSVLMTCGILRNMKFWSFNIFFRNLWKCRYV